MFSRAMIVAVDTSPDNLIPGFSQHSRSWKKPQLVNPESNADVVIRPPPFVNQLPVLQATEYRASPGGRRATSVWHDGLHRFTDLNQDGSGRHRAPGMTYRLQILV
jgi:hypothetical protein